MMRRRLQCKVELDLTGALPDFPVNPEVRETSWKVAPVPRRLYSRYLDLGDVSPANTDHFMTALNCPVNGIQTDFDDGHCPTWRTQLRGLYNVFAAVHGHLEGVPAIEKAPVLMLRPRAWNMIEHNMIVAGKKVPGPLFDFGMLMFHCSKKLIAAESGPFFYLSKLEGSSEAQLWNNIFVWAQNELGIPHGTIKACVLIENVLASFELEEILYALRDHSLGLNCGIWDYSASFVNKFGHRPDFVLPDRNKYVNMKRHFLKSYMDLVVHTCHKRGAHATGGMAATLLSSKDPELTTKIVQGKVTEMQAGVDGFMVYDVRLVPVFLKVGGKSSTSNQLTCLRNDVKVGPFDLLEMPSGGVTLNGLRHNIAVGTLFIYSWLEGKGHFNYKGSVEDSATAEISRSQLWQWIHHRATLEENGQTITRKLIQSLIEEFEVEFMKANSAHFQSETKKEQLRVAADMLEKIVTKRDFPEFITTYLNQDNAFRIYQKQWELV
ncbi:malate synthase-like isoform X2 [Oratosquilla oratoria]